MSASRFSPLVPRWCSWCQQPLQGRSDKQFCSAACRNMAARHGVVDGAPIDWPARAARAEQTVAALQAQLDQLAQARQALAPLERRYDEFPQVLLLLVPELQSSGMLTNLLGFVEQLVAEYAQHPGLAQGETGPQLRLQILQQVRATIVQQLNYLRPPEPAVSAGRAKPAEANSPTT